MVQATLYLLHYNNYYNRLVKKEDTLEGYMPYVIGNAVTGVNFIPNDYVDTQQIVNWDYDDPDYVLVVDEQGEIQSRWFVISTRRLRAGQIQLDLHRDLVADYKDEVVEAPMFIEKAVLEDSDPLLFNSEDMTFNQIKTNETELKDATGSAWIVGYITSKTETEDGQPLEIEADVDAAIGADEAVAGIANYWLYPYSNLAGNARQDLAGYPSKVAYCVYALEADSVFPSLYKVCFNESGGQPLGPIQASATGGTHNYTGSGSALAVYADQWNPSCRYTSLKLKWSSYFTNVDKWNTAFRGYYTILKSQVPDYIPVKSEQDTIALNDENGKIIYDSNTQKYYQVTVTNLGSDWSETPIPAGSMYNTFMSAYNRRATNNDAESGHYTGHWRDYVMNGTVPNESTFAIRTYGTKYKVQITELIGYGGSGYNVKISPNRYHLQDAPYDMFAIPYSDDLSIYKNGVELFKANKQLAFTAVMGLVRKYQAAGYIYDVQLLPFCPVQGMIKQNGTFDIGDNVVDYITYRPASTGLRENIGIIIYASNSSDTFNIPMNINWDENIEYAKKIAAMCDMYRLCSPNYNGQFEFNVPMNDGVDYFTVDFTYKPFNPYIHIKPNFKDLYGASPFNDARGLICGGEFSLPAVANQWDTYELQNKNYQNIFDRQIQNMEVNNSVQREREMWNIGFGTLSGGISGAAAGGMVGGPWGAVAGAAVGTVSSLAGGIADYSMNERLRNEALDYTKDMYGYNLGNIKALPYTLTRTTAFTYNNRIFPILEYYTCKDEEKNALIDKIKYNGMTVMKIGKISKYLQSEPSYIKGKLIRLENVDEDYHVINGIASELFKGVFI